MVPVHVGTKSIKWAEPRAVLYHFTNMVDIVIKIEINWVFPNFDIHFLVHIKTDLAENLLTDTIINGFKIMFYRTALAWLYLSRILRLLAKI